MKARFFIYDCNGDIVGNPKGYRTFRGANQQATSKRTKTYHEIWKRFDERSDKSNRTIMSIK